MSITLIQAFNQLEELTKNGRIATQNELRLLVNNVSVAAEGNLTILYGGEINGVYSGDIVKEIANNDPNIRWVQKTKAADFLARINGVRLD